MYRSYHIFLRAGRSLVSEPCLSSCVTYTGMTLLPYVLLASCSVLYETKRNFIFQGSIDVIDDMQHLYSQNQDDCLQFARYSKTVRGLGHTRISRCSFSWRIRKTSVIYFVTIVCPRSSYHTSRSRATPSANILLLVVICLGNVKTSQNVIPFLLACSNTGHYQKNSKSRGY